MLKYLFRIFFLFFTFTQVAVYAQTPGHTTSPVKDTVVVQSDSLTSGPYSDTMTQVIASEIKEDSIYIPIKDSASLNAYDLRAVPQSNLDKYLGQQGYEYANDPEYWKKDKIQDNPGPSGFWNVVRNKTFRWFVFLSVIAVVIYGIFLLARENNFKWFTRRSAEPNQDQPDSLLTGPVNYEEAIKKYQAEGNYRSAVRYLYLRLLHTASEKNIIPVHHSMTNAEIVQAFSQHSLGSGFRYLATAYEYVFYGDFRISQEVFQQLNSQFESFQQNLSA